MTGSLFTSEVMQSAAEKAESQDVRNDVPGAIQGEKVESCDVHHTVLMLPWQHRRRRCCMTGALALRSKMTPPFTSPQRVAMSSLPLL